jgi:C4-dicarboxylate-specific signal transduction histidine kinase
MSAGSVVGKKVLIVEDELIVAEALKEFLEKIGFTVVGVADTGVKAAMRFLATDPDVVLMDVRLKGDQDGIQVAEEIYNQRAVPIVFLTGNAEVATYERSKFAGSFGYVLKPFRDRELQIMMDMAMYRFQAENKLNQMQSALKSAELLSTVGALVSGIVHDCLSPVTAIDAELTMMRKHVVAIPKSPEQEMITARIESAKRTCEAMMSVMKNYRRLISPTHAAEIGPQSLKGCVVDAIEMCRFDLRFKGITINIKTDQPDIQFKGSKTSVLQVLINLIRNSSDAIEKTPDPWIGVEWGEVDAQSVFLRISDSGKGIPSELQEKIFAPLFSTKAPGKGTGLGLSLCQNLLSEIGGKLALDNDHPNTSFVVLLPR